MLNKTTQLYALPPKQICYNLNSTFTFFYLTMLKLLINFTSLKTRSLVWNRIQSIIGRQIGWTKTGYYKRIQLKIPNNVDYGKVKPLTVHPTPKLTFRTKSTLWNLFLQMWSTTRPKSNSHFTVNREFRLFFFSFVSSFKFECSCQPPCLL